MSSSRRVELLMCGTIDNFGLWQIKPGQYVEMISSMKPNLWVTLADEVPAWVSEKRNRASIERTLRWLDDCLKLSKANNVCGKLVITYIYSYFLTMDIVI